MSSESLNIPASEADSMPMSRRGSLDKGRLSSIFCRSPGPILDAQPEALTLSVNLAPLDAVVIGSLFSERGYEPVTFEKDIKRVTNIQEYYPA